MDDFVELIELQQINMKWNLTKKKLLCELLLGLIWAECIEVFSSVSENCLVIMSTVEHTRFHMNQIRCSVHDMVWISN